MSLPTKLVHIRFSEELLQKIAVVTSEILISRNEFIRQAVFEKLRAYMENPLPGPEGFNILLTNKQLDEMAEIIRLERHRRHVRYWDNSRQ